MRLNCWGLVSCVVLVLPACDTANDEQAQPRPTVVTSQPAPTAITSPAIGTDINTCRVTEPPQGNEATTNVWVYYFCHPSNFPRAEELYALTRSIPKTTTVLRPALEELLKGPTPEEARRGFRPMFFDATPDLLVDAIVTEDGVAVVDFAKELGQVGNISATSFAEAVRLSLEATVRQFPNVKDTLYRLDGDRAAWCDLFELDCG